MKKKQHKIIKNKQNKNNRNFVKKDKQIIHKIKAMYYIF